MRHLHAAPGCNQFLVAAVERDVASKRVGRRGGPHLPTARLAMVRDRSRHSVHYIVEAMTRKRSVWISVLAAIPISLAAQDRLRTMPGYEEAQRVAREGPVG